MGKWNEWEEEILIEEKEENLKCIVNIFNRSEKNCFVYLKLLISKDAVKYEINQLKEIIDCQTKDFEQENCFR